MSDRTGMPGDAREAARDCIERGWAPIPVPRGQKGPVLKKWPTLRLVAEDIERSFDADSNLGVLLGEPSGGLVDVDIDAPEVIALTDAFLPPTGLVHGRPGKPKSHHWYISPDTSTTRFTDLDGTSLVEIRSTGAQTLIPPSIHPSGEPYDWVFQGQPAPIDGAELHAAVARLAACALVARHWPTTGSRHECALALGGLLLRAGWPLKDAEEFVVQATRAASDEESYERGRDVQDTHQAILAGEPVTGGPTLVQLLGEGVLKRLRDWLNLAPAQSARSEPESAGPYRVEGGHLCREKQTRDGPILEPLCNFVARVVEEIALDDGQEMTRAFKIEGCLDDGTRFPAIRVPVTRFPSMSWVTEAWGLRAIVRAGQATRDHLREGIQRLSSDAGHRRIFTHTGWREFDGEWRYLTANGAVGVVPGGDHAEIDLGLSDLQRYQLPAEADDPVGAMQTSLQFLQVAPLAVTAPLWAAVYRAPLASIFPLDCSLWLEGTTGSLKSSLAAVCLAHYGAFDRTHLPGAWSSTANQLERRAFVLKDALFVIDDYAPTGLDAREIETKAARLLRSQGNLAGRGRLRSDLTERPAFPPRGLILATGEQHPAGQSILARLLLIQLEKRVVNLDILTRLQGEAIRLPHALTGYLRWLAPQMPELPASLGPVFEQARRLGTARGAHLRVPEAIAQLWLGFSTGMDYAVEIGACSEDEANRLHSEGWRAFLTLGRNQARLVEGERPTRRFLEVLATLVNLGRMTLLPKGGAEATLNAGLEAIGWRDDQFLYLTPHAAYAAVCRFCRESGAPFPFTEDRLRKELQIDRISVCDPDRLTATVWIRGQTRRLLKLDGQMVERLMGEPFPRNPIPPPPHHSFRF